MYHIVIGVEHAISHQFASIGICRVGGKIIGKICQRTGRPLLSQLKHLRKVYIDASSCSVNKRRWKSRMGNMRYSAKSHTVGLRRGS